MRFQLDWPTVQLFLYHCGKRLGDIVVSVLGIILLGIPMLVAAVGIKVESHGPVLDFAERLGKDGRPFVLMRFHSLGTRTGRFLQKTHLESAPQLFNVLMGSMSIIGPRAETSEFYQAARKEIPMIGQRLLVRPGMSGLEQTARNAETVGGAETLDLEYVRRQSAVLDAKLFAVTIFLLFRQDGDTARE